MSGPISVDLPHNLGAEEARRRIAANIGGLTSHLPPGAAVVPRWEGNRLKLDIAALGQELSAGIDVQERLVRVSVLLPPALAFFSKAIEAGLRRSGSALLEDKSKDRG
jgi:hypothetical protein